MTRAIGVSFSLCLLFINVPSAHALKVVVATIFAGEVQVIGIKAMKNADISWEGDVVTKSNKGGVFQFSTANLPIDCVGQLSDGVTTIPVVVFGCTTQGGGSVLETGQTQCDTSFVLGACPGNPAGQDGELQKGTARSYTSNADGTITDNSTGLVWEKLTTDGTIHDISHSYTWPLAFQKIADLNTAHFAGHNDWRLPNVNELHTLVNYGRVEPAMAPEFNNGTDSFTQRSHYWSSTTVMIEPLDAWHVGFNYGGVEACNKACGRYVRAVRGGS